MKLRHAAALALTGWYLIVPPAPEHKPVPPLYKWVRLHDFDTAAQREQCRCKKPCQQRACQMGLHDQQRMDYCPASCYAHGTITGNDASRATIRASNQNKPLALSNSDTQARIKQVPTPDPGFLCIATANERRQRTAEPQA